MIIKFGAMLTSHGISVHFQIDMLGLFDLLIWEKAVVNFFFGGLKWIL